MEKIFNDIVTFVYQMHDALKISLIALFSILELLLIRSFIKNLANKDNKPKIKILNIIFIVIITALIIFISVYGF